METFHRILFEHLGNLFYALAAENGVTELELGEVKLMLRQDWLTDAKSPKDQVSEPAHLMAITIDNLHATNTSESDAFRKFERYYNEHPEIFSEALKHKVREIATLVAGRFSLDRGGSHLLKRMEALLSGAPRGDVVSR